MINISQSSKERALKKLGIPSKNAFKTSIWWEPNRLSTKPQTKTIWLQERAQIHMPLPSYFRQSRWPPDRYLPLYSLKHRNVLSSYYSDEYRNRLLCFGINNSKRLERRDYKPGGSNALNHQAFWIYGGKREGSKRNANLHSLNSLRTQRLLYKLRLRQKRADNLLNRLLLDKASRTASSICFRPNSPPWLLKKSPRRLYNTRNCSQGRANLQKEQLTNKGPYDERTQIKLLVDR